VPSAAPPLVPDVILGTSGRCVEDMTEEKRMRSIAQVLMVGTVCLFSTQALAQGTPGQTRPPDASAQQLRRDLEIMKEQMRQMQDKIQQQEEAIEKLSAPATPPVPTPTPVPAPPATRDREQLKQEVREEVLRDIQPQLSAANKTFPSQFNPAIGLAIDNIFAYRQHEGNNFEFRSAELGLSASVDPFVRGYAFFNGTSDGFEVEEAAIVTTSLPFNLAVKGGRFFADFGRLAKFHDHDLPFVNRPVSVERFVGGESQADGFEVSYLLPIEHYVTLTAGMYNKIGAENDRVSNEVPRDLGEFTYLGRVATFISLSDAHSIDLGASYAYTPQVAIEEKANRHLVGLDLTYRYVPPGQAAYRGLVWGTEVFFNRENRPVGGFPTDPTIPSPVVFERNNAWGVYTYLEARLSRRLYPGFLFDYAQALDAGVGNTKTYSPYLTFWLSEFQRLRLQYTYLTQPGTEQQPAYANQVFLQWTIVLGSHAHGFRDR
jgi:hypothetical protein